MSTVVFNGFSIVCDVKNLYEYVVSDYDANLVKAICIFPYYVIMDLSSKD